MLQLDVSAVHQDLLLTRPRSMASNGNSCPAPPPGGGAGQLFQSLGGVVRRRQAVHNQMIVQHTGTAWRGGSARSRPRTVEAVCATHTPEERGLFEHCHLKPLT